MIAELLREEHTRHLALVENLRVAADPRERSDALTKLFKHARRHFEAENATVYATLEHSNTQRWIAQQAVAYHLRLQQHLVRFSRAIADDAAAQAAIDTYLRTFDEHRRFEEDVVYPAVTRLLDARRYRELEARLRSGDDGGAARA